ncbi:MFS transporter, partial [Candidatus Microgenomates bacterium]|nr:MFS transporter [Candidatus Microgenomates bacterium]
GASWGFGFIIGPVISALTVGISPSLPFIIAGVISIISVLLTMTLLPETNKHKGQVSREKLWDFGKMFGSLKDKNVGPTLLITLLSSLAFMSFIYGFNSFSVKGLHLSPTQISLIFTLIGVIGVITQFTILSPVIKKLGMRRAFYGSLIVMGSLFLGLFFVRSTIPYMILCMFISLPNSFVGPLISTILSKEADVKSQGSIMGLSASYMSVGQILGPIMGGVLASISLSMPFLLASIIIFICVVLAHKSLSVDHHKESAF